MEGSRGEFDTDRREEGNEIMQTDIGLMQPQAKECWLTLEARRDKQ